jgi:hypothetical protein
MTTAPIIEELKVELLPDEVAQRAKELAEVLRLVDRLEAERLSENSAKLAIIKTHRDRARQLSEIVWSSEETRPIMCYENHRYSESLVERFRGDTNELVSTRPMTPDELQQQFPFDSEQELGKEQEVLFDKLVEPGNVEHTKEMLDAVRNEWWFNHEVPGDAFKRKVHSLSNRNLADLVKSRKTDSKTLEAAKLMIDFQNLQQWGDPCAKCGSRDHITQRCQESPEVKLPSKKKKILSAIADKAPMSAQSGD